ncbi:MAG: DUF4440 domain-containing protein [Acidobacteriota bacterium]
MNDSRTTTGLILIALFLTACATATSSSRERDTLLAVDREWAAAASEGKDVERIVSFWSDDATVYPPGAPVVHGKAAIRDFVRQSQAIPGFHITWHSDHAWLSDDGTLGYTTAENAVTVPGPDGKLVTIKGRGVSIWRRDAGGQWKCVIDIWNSGADAPAPPPDDVAELTKLLDTFLAGASGNDAGVHDRFWADDLIYTGSAGRRTGKADILRDIRSAPPAKPDAPTTTFTAEEVRVQQYGDAAIVAFRLVGTTVDGGRTIVSKYLNSGTFLDRNGKWQVVSWQATKVPRSEDDAKKEVAAAEATFHQAVLAGDVKTLESIVDETFIWTHRTGEQMTRAQLLDAIGAGKLKYPTPEMKNIVINIYGDAAVVRGTYNATFVNKGGVWKAVALHSSRAK